jgi:hypothetical protein
MSGPTIESAEGSANPRDHAALHRMMAENFTGVYLTMLSIIQGRRADRSDDRHVRGASALHGAWCATRR